MSDVTISDVMSAYSRDAVEHASMQGVVLNYSEESLEQVDLLLHRITVDGLLSPNTSEQEGLLWTMSKMYGGYLGEVVIRNFGGNWEQHDNPDGSARVVLRTAGVQMFPPEKVYKRLTEDQFSNVSGYCRALRLIIKQQGEEK